MVEAEPDKEVRLVGQAQGRCRRTPAEGENLDEQSRELRVQGHRRAAWQDEFMAMHCRH